MWRWKKEKWESNEGFIFDFRFCHYASAFVSTFNTPGFSFNFERQCLFKITLKWLPRWNEARALMKLSANYILTINPQTRLNIIALEGLSSNTECLCMHILIETTCSSLLVPQTLLVCRCCGFLACTQICLPLLVNARADKFTQVNLRRTF